MKRNSKHFLVLLLTILASFDRANAQPLGKSFHSLESLIAPSEFVAIGRIDSATEHVIVKPDAVDESGARHGRGKIQYTLKPKFDEVLKKGQTDEAEKLQSLRTYDFSVGVGTQLETWVKRETIGIWFVGPKVESGELRTWSFVPLDEQGVSHLGYWTEPIPPIFANDFSILDSKEKILTRVREYGPISQMEHDPKTQSVVRINIPRVLLGELEGGDYNMLQLAIDSNLETTARKLILSPEEFASAPQFRSDRYLESSLREAGINLLRHFKNDVSIKLIQECLDESVLPFAQSGGDLRNRINAYELLLHWNVDQPLPKCSADITELILPSTDINDKTLEAVGKLPNLQEINLWDTGITHVGIAHLANLKKLRELKLDNEHLTDETLQVLRKNGQLHLISQANVHDESRRPVSPEEVARLSFWAAPFSDIGLKEFEIFENLNWIDLRRTAITDTGLQHLEKLKKLEWVLLDETKVTPAGIAKFHKALPNCRIEH